LFPDFYIQNTIVSSKSTFSEYYFQFRIFISEIKDIFRIFEITFGAGSKVLGAGSNCLYIKRVIINTGKLGPNK